MHVHCGLVRCSEMDTRHDKQTHECYAHALKHSKRGNVQDAVGNSKYRGQAEFVYIFWDVRVKEGLVSLIGLLFSFS